MSEVLRGSTLRPRVPDGIGDMLRREYGIAADEIKDLGGSSNLNLLIQSGENQYIARIYRPWVTLSRLTAIQLAHRTLNDGGVPSPLPVSTRDGKDASSIDGLVMEVEHWVERDADMDTWETLEAGLPWLGRAHTLLQDLKVSEDGKDAPAHNNIEATDALAQTLEGAKRIRAWNPTPEQLRLAAASEELAHLLDAAEREITPALPRQLVHGDFWDNNVFFRNGKVVLVTDLDFMGERARIDDLALTLYYTNSTFDDDQTTDDRARRLRTLVDAYDSGLAHKLTQAERIALPLALARTPLAFIAMIAVIDTEETARNHADGMAQDVQWALTIAKQAERWQAIFQSS